MKPLIVAMAFGGLLAACGGAIPVWVENAVLCFYPCAKTSVRMAPIDTPDLRARDTFAFRIAAPEGCDMASSPPARFGELSQRVLVRRCGINGACHFAGANSEAGLDLARPDARAELLDLARGASRCTKETGIAYRVVRNDPDHSMLWQIVSGSRCGPHMPLRSSPLNCDDQSLIYGWIQAGAAE